MLRSVCWLVVVMVVVLTSRLAGESQAGLCSYTATNSTLLCSNLTRLHLITGTEESHATLRNLQIVDSKVCSPGTELRRKLRSVVCR